MMSELPLDRLNPSEAPSNPFPNRLLSEAKRYHGGVPAAGGDGSEG